MQHIPEDYCSEFMDYLRNRVTCEWCHHPKEPVMPRIRLCGHCNRIRKGLERIEADAEAYRQQHGGIHHQLDRTLRVQRRMAQDAQTEGRKYGNMFDDVLADTTLEYEFRFLSKKATGKD